jgi:hypothetical protein
VKRRLIGWVLTTVVAVVAHEMGGRHLVSSDVILAATRHDLVPVVVAAMLIFSRLWLMFVVPATCAALLASTIWRRAGGRTDTEERLRRAVS